MINEDEIKVIKIHEITISDVSNISVKGISGGTEILNVNL